MPTLIKRKERILNLFSLANTGDNIYSGEDVYDYSSFIKENFYNPDDNPDLKIDIQDMDYEIVEEFDLVLERLEILLEKRFHNEDEDMRPHNFSELFKKELQDMISRLDGIVIEVDYEELTILYRMFGQYIKMYDDYSDIVT